MARRSRRAAPVDAAPEPPPSVPTALDRDAPAKLYTQMVSSLEKATSADQLGALFLDLRGAGVQACLPLDDGEIKRLFSRLGLLPPGATAEEAALLAEEFVRRTAEGVSRTPAQVSLVLRLFAAGQPGFLEDGLCASIPRCENCDLTKICQFHNEPPRPLQDKIPPLKRLANDGPEALSDHEALALLLAGSRAGDIDLERANALFARYGTLRQLFAAPYAELAGLRDLNTAMAARLAGAAVLHRRLLGERRILGPAIRHARDLYDLFHADLRDLTQEVFMVALLTAGHRLIRAIRVASGGTAGVQVDPAAVFRPALKEGAAAVAFLHNHPSGDTRPSEADYALTRRLRASADTLRVRLLDHVIIGENAYTSFVDEGVLDPVLPDEE